MNKLFDVGIIGAGTKGSRIAKSLMKQGKTVVVFDDKINMELESTNSIFINKKVIFVQYIRGILGLTVETFTQPEFFCKNLILATDDISMLPKNFYKKINNRININEKGQLPEVSPLVYILNNKLIKYSKNLENIVLKEILKNIK